MSRTMIIPLKPSRTPKGSLLAQVVLASLAVLACDDLLGYGPEPTLRSSDATSVQGGGVGEVDDTGGTLGGSGSTSKVPNGTYGGGSSDKDRTERFVGSGGTREASGTGGATGGSGGTREASGTGGATGGAFMATSFTSTTKPSPTYTCSVDVMKSTNDCAGPVQVTALESQMGVLAVDMSDYELLTLEVDVVEPQGFVLDIGDSSCNDAGGGDCNVASNDAELDIQETSEGAFPMVLYLNDDALANGVTNRTLDTYPDFFAKTQSAKRTLQLSDGKVCLGGTSKCWQSAGLLRLNAPDTQSNTPDNNWYIGLNRVVWEALRNPPRIGRGVRNVTLWLQ